MSHKKPSAEQYRQLAGEIYKEASTVNNLAQVMSTKFSQALLMIATNLPVEGRQALMALHEEFLIEMDPFRAHERLSFDEAFSGHGTLASYLREKTDLSKIAPLYPEHNGETILDAIRADLVDFDYGLYQDEKEIEEFKAFLSDLHKNAHEIMPPFFNKCDDFRGFLGVCNQEKMVNIEKEYASGFYEDTARPCHLDGSFPWILFIKKTFFPRSKHAVHAVLLLRQGWAPQVLIQHPLEDCWYEWDQCHLIPGMTEALLREYTFISIPLMSTSERGWDFEALLAQIKKDNGARLRQHAVLPKSQIMFQRAADKPKPVFGDFMFVDGSARLTVTAGNVCLVIYCSEVNGQWGEEIRFIRPQNPNCLISIPVDLKDIPLQQQRVLVQRAFHAIERKNQLIIQHQQKEKEST